MNATKEAMLDRQHMLHENLDKARSAYREAIAQGMVDPAVAIVDCRQPGPRRLAEGLVGRNKVDEETVRCEAARLIPTLIFAAPRPAMSDSLGRLTPNGRTILSRAMPPGSFWAVTIAEGGSSYAVVGEE
jgi:hypothetical protein